MKYWRKSPRFSSGADQALLPARKRETADHLLGRRGAALPNEEQAALAARADKAMYVAKKSGKNRVIVAE